MPYLTEWGATSVAVVKIQFSFFFSSKKLRLGLALALTLEFIYMLGMKLSGDIYIAVVLGDNLQLLAIDRLLF